MGDNPACAECGENAVIFVDPDFVGDGHGQYYCEKHGVERLANAIRWLISKDRKTLLSLPNETIPHIYFWWHPDSIEIVTQGIGER